MPNSVQELYGNRVRTRVCGICITDDRLLMVNHKHLTDGSFWAPPGGGIEMNEIAHQTLEREFREETNLTVEVGELLFVAEYYQHPLHAIELFFMVKQVGGSLQAGNDPEMKPQDQIITDARFLSWDEIGKIDVKHLHGVFKLVPDPSKIIDLRGYIKL